jgi:hypothetical protein
MSCHLRYLLPALAAVALRPGVVPSIAQAQESPTPLARALDRAVLRVQRRDDLKDHLGAGFNRDSFDLQAIGGLGRTEDSTLIRWFTGFTTYVNGTDSSACRELINGEPTGTRLAALNSSMDSVAVERWAADWETAVAASYLSPPHATVDEEELMVAIFALIAKLPESEISVNRKPSAKPQKMNAHAECRMMRRFFVEAMAMEEPVRLTLLRGLAMTMREKGESSFNLEQ